MQEYGFKHGIKDNYLPSLIWIFTKVAVDDQMKFLIQNDAVSAIRDQFCLLLHFDSLYCKQCGVLDSNKRSGFIGLVVCNEFEYMQQTEINLQDEGLRGATCSHFPYFYEEKDYGKW